MSAVPEDALSIAVGAAWYWHNAGPSPVPESFVVRWGVGRHPCDGSPYLVGLDFPRPSTTP